MTSVGIDSGSSATKGMVFSGRLAIIQNPVPGN